MPNVELIRNNIYRIGIPLKGNPLKELNSYFIKGEKFDLLIDTGFRTQSCEEALRNGLEELNSDNSRRHLAITHLHSDHAAMGDLFVGKNNPIYMSSVDFNIMSDFVEHIKERSSQKALETNYSMGFTDEMLDYLDKNSPMKAFYIHDIKNLNFVLMKDQDIIDMGDRKLKWVSTPGHTPGNSMLWDEDNKIMFTGDNILFDITPNTTNWENVKDSLGDYLNSLDYADSFPVELALPGHRQTGDYHKRIAEIKKHHEVRLNEVINCVFSKPGLSAIEIAGNMTWDIKAKNWDEFPIIQKWFAVGECQAHLDYLLCRNIIRKERDGILWKYYKY